MNIQPYIKPEIYLDTTDPSLEGLNLEPAFAYSSIERLMVELENVRMEVANQVSMLNLNEYEIEDKLKLYPQFVLYELGINLEDITKEVFDTFCSKPYTYDVINRLMKKYVTFFGYIVHCEESYVLSDELFKELLKFSLYAPHLIVPLLQILELKKQLLIKVKK